MLSTINQRDSYGHLQRFRTFENANIQKKPEWWKYCVFLSHFDSIDQATCATDLSPSQHLVMFHGDAQLDDTYKKFGATSSIYDGSDDYVALSASSDWDFSDNDFTLDFWFYPKNDSKRQGLFSGYTDTTGFGIDFHYFGTRNVNIWATSSNGSWNLIDADGTTHNGTGTTSLALNTWHHIAFTRSGSTFRLFLNGSIETTVTGISDSLAYIDEVKCLGRWGYNLDHGWLEGQIDEVRILNGYAAWTADFTPPTKAYLS